MSRHGFHHVLNRPCEGQEDLEELEDLIGYGIYDWLSRGVAGYDEQLETFFFNIEGSWIFGTEPGEIPSIGLLQAILSAIFSGAELPFNQEGLRMIAEEVDRYSAVLDPAEAADLSNTVSATYLEKQVALANYFRGEEAGGVMRELAPATSAGPDHPKRGFLSRAFHYIFLNK
ncbi:hypothetical protein [Modicisalibacter xianhensis]|uniref:Uncharacterized protein n=1 Tax=Modicisalibacter xianhensis TaxID=442341 RepID=A0A1I3FR87_9GAMM|nr:hypothetical protein [Halomonas xianhensis]SFI13627.1 hypothetical protein SAMN04487959_12048 [Halomonas xianhensis]